MIQMPMRLLNAVRLAYKERSTRYAINGLLIEVESKDKVRVCATDGRRLIVAECTHFKRRGDSVPTRILLPGDVARKALVWSLKKYDKADREAGFTEPTVQIHAETITFTSKVGPVSIQFQQVEGEFPKYQEVIPEDTDKPTPVIKLNPRLTSETLETVWQVAGSEVECVTLRLPEHPNKPFKVLSVEGADTTVTAVQMPVGPIEQKR